MSDLSTDRQPLRDISGLWWLMLGLGLLSTVAGIIVLIEPGNSLKAIAVISGIFVLIDGIVALVAALSRSTENRGLAALIGVLNLIVGVLLIRHPIGGVVAVALLVGLWLIVAGAVRFLLAFEADRHRIWRFLLAAVEIVAGIAIVSSPRIGVATLALLVGLALIGNGVSLGALGFVLHSAGREEAAPVPREPAAAV